MTRVHPEIIVCLGATAAHSILGNAFRLTKERGRFIEHPWAPQVTATVHPSAILRATDREQRHIAYREFVADLEQVRRALKIAKRSLSNSVQRAIELSKETVTKMESLRDVLIEELKDLYDAEKQLVKALPKMAKAASNDELREAFESHLEETKGHVQRLEQAFQLLEEKAKSKPCEAMKGLIAEGQETMQEDFSEPLLDSAIICAAQKVEHYEIAGYGTVCAWARSLGLEDVADLLDQTLAEEKAADEKLTEVAGNVISEAGAAAESSDEEEEEGETVGAGSAPRKGTSNKAASDNKSRRRAV